MKTFLLFFILILFNCQSQVGEGTSAQQKKEIQFEDRYHYPFSLTQKDFIVIDSQQKMDEIFTIIHQKNSGNRLSPIPTVVENETFIIVKPQLKNSNDVSIEKINLENKTLTIKVKELDNPDFKKTSRISPNILLKLQGNIIFKKIIIKY